MKKSYENKTAAESFSLLVLNKNDHVIVDNVFVIRYEIKFV